MNTVNATAAKAISIDGLGRVLQDRWVEKMTRMLRRRRMRRSSKSLVRPSPANVEVISSHLWNRLHNDNSIDPVVR